MINTNQDEDKYEELKLSPLGTEEINSVIKSFKNSTFNQEELYNKDKNNFVKKTLFDLAKESEKISLEENQSEIDISKQDNDLEKLSENGDLDSSQEGEIENTQSEMLTLHLENSEESKFSYDAIKKFLGSNKIEYKDEGGWFKILIEENDSFLLINGLNPGKFIPEDGLLETQVMTLVYSFKPKANSVSAFSKMIDIAQLMAENFQSEILDSDRNNLTKQMVDHYSQIAEEFDLKNLA